MFTFSRFISPNYLQNFISCFPQNSTWMSTCLPALPSSFLHTASSGSYNSHWSLEFLIITLQHAFSLLTSTATQAWTKQTYCPPSSFINPLPAIINAPLILDETIPVAFLSISKPVWFSTWVKKLNQNMRILDFEIHVNGLSVSAEESTTPIPKWFLILDFFNEQCFAFKRTCFISLSWPEQCLPHNWWGFHGL